MTDTTTATPAMITVGTSSFLYRTYESFPLTEGQMNSALMNAIREEAYAENHARSTAPEVTTDRTAQAKAILAMRTREAVLTARNTELERQLAERTATIHNLRTEQIDGSDSRLANFWETAQELADEAGHCEVFDNLADALGGPRRSATYAVQTTVTLTVTINVEARDEDEAIEQVDEMDSSDIERAVADMSYYSLNVSEFSGESAERA